MAKKIKVKIYDEMRQSLHEALAFERGRESGFARNGNSGAAEADEAESKSGKCENI